MPIASDQSLRTTTSGRRQALRRNVALTAGIVGVAALGYVGLRAGGAFGVDSIRVTGASGVTERAVLTAADARAGGVSLLAVDPSRLAVALERLPSVRRAHVSRDFPHTLRISIVPERVVAVVRLGGRAVTVAQSGRIVGVRAAAAPSLIAPDGLTGQTGGYVTQAGVRRELEVAAAIPSGFPVRVASIAATADGLVATTAAGAQIRLGDETDLGQKLEVAGRVLRGMSADARDHAQYIEVSAPDFPAVMAATPDKDTAGLVPEAGVQIPSLSKSGQGGSSSTVGVDVQSDVQSDPGSVAADLFSPP